MKKMFIALLLMLALVTPCFAQTTTEIPVINWEDVEDVTEEIEGSWFTFEYYSIDLWIPDVFQDTELSEDDAENVIGKFIVPDGSAGIYVQYVEGNDGTPVEELAAGLAASGAADVAICRINGLDAISYAMPDVDGIFVIFFTDTEDYLQFFMTPASDEAISQVAQLVTASVMPSED